MRTTRKLKLRADRLATNFTRRNIVLTGPGRSGTTLTCYLLNKLSNTVALSEPIRPAKFVHRRLLSDREAVCDKIEDYYRSMRDMVLGEGLAISKHVGGVVPDNTKGMVGGVRRRIAEQGKIIVDGNIYPGFYLAIKQPAMFTALLPELSQRLPCYAIVRNPLAIMASASSIQTPKKKTRSATARYDPGFGDMLKEQRNKGTDGLDRRILKLHYSFARYEEILPEGHVLRYEDIVSSRGGTLEKIVPHARRLDEPLENKNINSLYDRDQVLRLGERLLKSEGAFWNFYSRESVEEIMAGFE